MIAKKQFDISEYADPSTERDARTKARMYVVWWREGRKQTPEQFKALYTQWKAMRTGGGRMKP